MDGLYRALLRVLPRDFDREEMWETYQARISTAGRRAGPRGAALERVREVLDLLGTVVVERWPLPSLDSLTQDVRIGFRSLRRSPLASGLAVLSLALGVGVTTAVYSVAAPIALKPLPLPNAERLISVMMAADPVAGFSSFTARDYYDWAQASRSIPLMVYAATNHNLAIGDGARRVRGLSVSANALQILGIVPVLGRGFTAQEGTPAGPRVALVTDAFFRGVLGGDPGIVGTEILLDGVPHTVVGVLPPGEGIPSMPVDVWTPLRISGSEPRVTRFLWGVGLLEPAMDIAAARSELNAVAASAAARGQTRLRYARVAPLRDVVYGPDERGAGTVLIICSLFVLLIACSNIANILFARGLNRTREMAVRGALGAGRGRLLQQLLVESVILAVIGGAVGVGLGYGALHLMLALLVRPGTPGFDSVGIEGRAAAVAASLTIVSLLIFGLGPAARASRANLRERLADGGRAGVSRSRSRLASALVVGEIAATLVLATFTGLLGRSLFAARRVDVGMRSSGALVFRIQTDPAPSSGAQLDSQHVASFYHDLAARLEAVPGVSGVATTSSELMSFGATTGYSIGDRSDGEARGAAEYRRVTPAYLDVMQLEMLAGRWFDEGVDVTGGPPVAVVSRALALLWWSAPREALGHTLQMGERTTTIVGVVDPGRLRGPLEPPPPVVFIPFAQAPSRTTFNVVVHSLDEGDAAAAVRAAIHDLDPGLAVFDMRTIESLRDDALVPVTAGSGIFAVLGALALLLTLGGVYGVVAHSVARRTHEMGVRLALGAHAGTVVGAMVLRSGRLALAGIAVGIVVSLAGGRLLTFFLFGVNARDPAVLTTVPLLLAAVVLLAAYLPARRVALIDPVDTLRAE